MQALAEGTIAGPLTVGKNGLHEGVVEVAGNEIAAFSAIFVIGKVRGNRNSMLFQSLALADQLLLLRIVVVVRGIRPTEQVESG